jgi:RNA polymerase sigma-70 factor (sigma-E family)
LGSETDFSRYVAARLAQWSRVAFLLTGDQHQAEDLVQLTFERVARHWERVSADGDPDPYVRRILHTQHVSTWRRRWRDTELHADPPDRPLPDATGSAENAVVVRQALARLTARQRAVLVLRFFEDRTEVQTARVLGCSVSTIKSTVREALARLRVIAPELVDLVDSAEPAVTAEAVTTEAVTTEGVS